MIKVEPCRKAASASRKPALSKSSETAAESLDSLPPGTSKWNKIEHRLFSLISQNWRGKPLISHEVKGVVVSDEDLAQVNIDRDDFPADSLLTDSISHGGKHQPWAMIGRNTPFEWRM